MPAFIKVLVQLALLPKPYSYFDVVVKTKPRKLYCKLQRIIHLLEFQAAGKYRQQGRNYTVGDGDIIFFKFNAGAGLTAGKKK